MIFNSVHISEGMQADNPASINISSGELFLNKHKFFSLPEDHRVLILLHELGHYRLKTKNEFKADNFAFKNFVNYGGSLKSTVKSISDTLKGEPEHYLRLENRIKMAKAADQNKITNYVGPSQSNDIYLTQEQYEALEIRVDQQEQQVDREIALIEAEILQIDGQFLDAEQRKAEYDLEMKTAEAGIKLECDQLNNKKRARDCRSSWTAPIHALRIKLTQIHDEIQGYRGAKIEKQFRKTERTIRKTEIRKVKAESKAYRRMTLADGKTYRRMATGDSKALLAQQGQSQAAMVSGNVMGGLGDIAQGIGQAFGGGGAQPQQQQPQDNMILISVVALAVLLGGAYFIMNRK